MYDTVPDAVEAKNDVVSIDMGNDDDPYSTTNGATLEQPIFLGQERHEAVGTVLVWDGVSRGKNDYTDNFGAQARKLGLPVSEVRTI